MRLIDADAQIKLLSKFDWQEAYLPIHFKEFIIDETPTVEAQPVIHAHWDDTLDGITPYCTNCKRTHNCLSNRTPDYCPNCGAIMDEEVK